MFSDYLGPKILDHIHGKTSFTMPATVYVAASTTVPTRASSSITEPSTSGTAYARVAMNAAAWAAAAAGSPHAGSSAADAAFAQATANWGTVQGYATYDSGTVGAGNYLEGFDKDSGGSAISVIVNNGDTLKVPSGTLTSKIA